MPSGASDLFWTKPVREIAVAGLGQPDHEDPGFLHPEAVVSGLAVRSGAGSTVGVGDLSRDSGRGASTRGRHLLCRRVGHPLGLPHRHHLGAHRANTRCGGLSRVGNGSRGALAACPCLWREQFPPILHGFAQHIESSICPCLAGAELNPSICQVSIRDYTLWNWGVTPQSQSASSAPVL